MFDSPHQLFSERRAHQRIRIDSQEAKPEPDSTWSNLQPVGLVSEFNQLPQKVPMDFEVLLFKLKGVQTPANPIRQNVHACFLQALGYFIATGDLQLHEHVLTAGPERDEVAHHTTADNADVVLVVLEVRSRLDLSHQAEQAVHQRNGVMRRPGLPVVAVPRLVRLLALLDAQGRAVKDRCEDERDRVKHLDRLRDYPLDATAALRFLPAPIWRSAGRIVRVEMAYVEHHETWKRERRRTGAALIAGAGLAAVGWYDASQTFVVVTAKNTLVHPSFWNWILIPLVLIVLVGVYCYVATYRHLPLLGRAEAKEKDRRQMHQEVHYALVMERLDTQKLLAPVQGINLVLNFTNIARQTIEIVLNRLVIVPKDGKTLDGKATVTLDGQKNARIPPGQPLQVTSGSLVYGASPFPWEATLEFVARYGLPDNLLFEQRRVITYSWNGEAPRIHDDLNTDEAI
jgi:hypothetical protein